MKSKAKVLAVKDNLAKIELDTNKLKPGDIIEVRWGKQRTLRQNNLYWGLLSYVCNECDLWKDHAHTPETIHTALKQHFISEKELDKGTFKLIEEGSTTDLDSREFRAYMEKADSWLCDFFSIDTSRFWLMVYEGG